MSEEVHNTEANAEEQKGSVSENQPNMDDLMKRMEMLERTNERLLEESKGYKNRYRELRDGVEEEKKKQLEQQENWKELLDIEKNKTHSLQENLHNTKKQVLKEKLHYEVARHAKDAFDVNDVIAALPRDMVNINDETLEVSGVADAVSLLKEKKPYFFEGKKSSGQPSMRPIGSNGKVSYEELSKNEQDELFRKALVDGGIVR